jgi:hypothetical protein
VQQTAYYPDWRYRPAQRPATLGGVPIEWDTPVYHVKVGGLKGMRFGVPETYAALDWARAYKSFLEDWATITRALQPLRLEGDDARRRPRVAAAKARLGTTLGNGARETNPPPVTGSTFIAAAGAAPT